MRPATEYLLRVVDRPTCDDGDVSFRLVDPFAACAGITSGLAQAASSAGYATEIALVIDFETPAARIRRAINPFVEKVATAAVESLLDYNLGSAKTSARKRTASVVRPVNMQDATLFAKTTAISTTEPDASAQLKNRFSSV